MKAFTITSILAAACLLPAHSLAEAAAENKTQAAAVQPAAGIPKPVSYTHLTLPTNSLV